MVNMFAGLKKLIAACLTKDPVMSVTLVVLTKRGNDTFIQDCYHFSDNYQDGFAVQNDKDAPR